MQEYPFPKATVSFIDGNIIRIQLKDNVELSESDALPIFELRQKIIGDIKYGVFLVHGKHSSITNEARKLAAQPEYALYRAGFAVVVKSLAQRLIGNFYIKFDNPPSPTRLFTDEKKALEWLRGIEEIKNSRAVK